MSTEVEPSTTPPGAAMIQVHKGRQVAGRLRVWGRQHLRAPGSSRRKVGSAFLLCSAGCRRRRRIHAAALRAGGRDNGAPGLRPVYDPDYCAAFVIDPDGYRIEAYYGPGET
jgi:hypothetical protein